MKTETSEKVLHRKICSLLTEGYPTVYYDSDSSGIRVSSGVARELKQTRSVHAHLDLTILEPRGKFKGLILEVKVVTPYLKDGSLSTNPHIQDQYTTMLLLESKGYKCFFCWSLEQAQDILKNYLGEPLIDDTPLFSS